MRGIRLWNTDVASKSNGGVCLGWGTDIVGLWIVVVPK